MGLKEVGRSILRPYALCVSAVNKYATYFYNNRKERT